MRARTAPQLTYTAGTTPFAANTVKTFVIPEGDFTLTVTGTVSVSGISSAINFVIEDMPAPDSLDMESIEQTFQDSMDEVPGLVITNTAFVVINNTADPC